MSDDLDTILEVLAAQEQAEVDQAHGEHLRAVVGAADKNRDETTRSLLEAISQARLAQEDKQK